MFNFQTAYQTAYGIIWYNISMEKDMFISVEKKIEVSLIICTKVNRGGIPL